MSGGGFGRIVFVVDVDTIAENYTTPGDVTRLVPLTQRANGLAAARIIGRDPDDYLFTSVTGRQLRSSRFRSIVAWSTTAPPGRSIHDLRHYAASAWLRAGIPVNQVAKWLGHASPSTTLNAMPTSLVKPKTSPPLST